MKKMNFTLLLRGFGREKRLSSNFAKVLCDFNVLKNCLLNVRVISHASIASSQTKHNTQPILKIFDRQTKILQRERAAISEDAEYHSYLKEEIGYRLADRIYDIKRKFPKVLDLTCDRGYVSKHVVRDSVEELTMCDGSELLISFATCEDNEVKTNKVVCDEENLLNKFKPDSFNMVITNLSLHWINDLPTFFKQVMTILKNDGVFLGSLFGGDTLYELRSSLQLAELERKGGISPHISPFARPRDIGGLLTQAGFLMQTIDTDEEILKYPSMFELLTELKGMGESNAALNRCLHLPRDVLLAASVIYKQLYGTTVKKEKSTNYYKESLEKKENEENFECVNATFQIIYFIGWKPDPSQPQPLNKDSAQMSLKDLYKLNDVIIKEGSNIKGDNL